MVQIVAEISGNHGGDLNKALEMIDTAADCGCDYVKFQYYRPEDMPDRDIGDNDAMYRKLMVRDHWLPDLYKRALRANIGLFASVFSLRGAKTLLEYNPPFIKFASLDSTPLSRVLLWDIYLLVRDRAPLIYSLNNNGHDPLGIEAGRVLWCPKPENIWQELLCFNPRCHYGLSDHTPGISAPLEYIRRGARMIEKHFKIDDDCIDAALSADPDTMATLCSIARHI